MSKKIIKMSIEKTSEDYIEEMIRMAKDTNENVSEKSDVTDFYSNCNIFITGGSGFIGKLLLEKVLRYVFRLYFHYYFGNVLLIF